jgi:hypothetical protein
LETIAPKEEATVKTLCLTEKQATAIHTWKCNAQKAALNDSAASRSVLNKQSKAKKK